MFAQRIVTLCLVLVVFSSTSLEAQESKSSSWWPFGASSKSDTETRSSSFFGSSTTQPKSAGSTMFKLPSWSKSKSKSKSKSSLSKMGSSTKKWMNSTTDFLNPFNDSKPKSSNQAHGYQTQQWTSRVAPEEKKNPGMFDWMWKEEENPKISSVNEFLSQEMPY